MGFRTSFTTWVRVLGSGIFSSFGGREEENFELDVMQFELQNLRGV